MLKHSTNLQIYCVLGFICLFLTHCACSSSGLYKNNTWQGFYIFSYQVYFLFIFCTNYLQLFGVKLKMRTMGQPKNFLRNNGYQVLDLKLTLTQYYLISNILFCTNDRPMPKVKKKPAYQGLHNYKFLTIPTDCYHIHKQFILFTVQQFQGF